MVTTTLIFEKYVLIMGPAFILSFVSVLIGLYYLVKFYYFVQMSSHPEKGRKYLFAGFVYFLFAPLVIIGISNNFLVRIFATRDIPIEGEGLAISGITVIHETNPFLTYFTIVGLAVIVYWINYMIKKRKTK